MGIDGSLSLINERIDKAFFLMNTDLFTKLNFDSMLRYHLNKDNILTIALREYKYEVYYGGS